MSNKESSEPVANEKLLTNIENKLRNILIRLARHYDNNKDTMTIDQAHDQIIELFRECLPKKEPLRLSIHLKDKLIELLHKFKGLCCASMMGEITVEYTHTNPCLFCRVKDDCGIVTSNAIEDLFSEVNQNIITEAEKKIGGVR